MCIVLDALVGWLLDGYHIWFFPRVDDSLGWVAARILFFLWLQNNTWYNRYSHHTAVVVAVAVAVVAVLVVVAVAVVVAVVVVAVAVEVVVVVVVV